MTEDYELSFREEDYLQNGLCFEKYKYFLERKFNNIELLNFGIDIEAGEKIIVNTETGEYVERVK